MANPPRLQVFGLSGASADEQAATASPARGAEMTNFLRSRLTGRRNNPTATQASAPALVHSWGFWHDRQDRVGTSGSEGNYEDRLEPLAEISDVKQFWGVLNNFDISKLKLRDSIHLFHKGVKPVWEDPRNARGGSWTFRVPTEKAQAFWQEICMMAIGEQLQAAVEDPTRHTFRDDICGVSLGVRTKAVLVQVWNRDADNAAGIEQIRATVMDNISEELRPPEDRLVYYKKHREHMGFRANDATPQPSAATLSVSDHTRPPRLGSGLRPEIQSLDEAMNGT